MCSTPGSRCRVTDVADHRIDVALELGGRHERVDRDRGDCLAGIGRLAGLLDEIDHVAAERRAIERAGEQSDDQAQAVALVVADRQQMALIGPLRIGQRLALLVDHPADRHHFAALRLESHFAIRRNRRRHVEHDSGLIVGRHRDRHRVGAEETLAAAPGRQVIVAADGEVKPDHVVMQRHGDVERRRAGMIAHARADPADAGGLGLLDRQMRGAAHDQVAHGIVAVDERGRGPVADHADVGLGVDAAGANAADIERQPDHAVGVAAAQIRLDHQSGDGFRVLRRQAGRREGADDERGKAIGRNARVGCIVHPLMMRPQADEG